MKHTQNITHKQIIKKTLDIEDVEKHKFQTLKTQITTSTKDIN